MNANRQKWVEAVSELTGLMEKASINYTLRGAAVLAVYGVDPPASATLTCEFQWDQLNEAYALFSGEDTIPIIKTEEGAKFQILLNGIEATFYCRWNVVVVTDPARMAYSSGGQTFYIEALTEILTRYKKEDPIFQLAKNYLKSLQDQNTAISRRAWNTGTFEAWVNRFGAPEQIGGEIRLQPDRRLVTLRDYIGDMENKKVLNLMGSNGIKGVAMAVKGADVTIVDLSEESADYANQLAEAAGVTITYIVEDVLAIEKMPHQGQVDLIVMERGILHYFVDLEPLMSKISLWLKKGGRFVLQDFHPISTKLIQSKGKKHSVSGNYFDPEIHATPVATTKYAETTETSFVNHCRWTLGEIITSMAEAGLFVQQLDERPNEKRSDIGIPKMFTIRAEKL